MCRNEEGARRLRCLRYAETLAQFAVAIYQGAQEPLYAKQPSGGGPIGTACLRRGHDTKRTPGERASHFGRLGLIAPTPRKAQEQQSDISEAITARARDGPSGGGRRQTTHGIDTLLRRGRPRVNPPWRALAPAALALWGRRGAPRARGAALGPQGADQKRHAGSHMAGPPSATVVHRGSRDQPSSAMPQHCVGSPTCWRGAAASVDCATTSATSTAVGPLVLTRLMDERLRLVEERRRCLFTNRSTDRLFDILP